MLSGLKKLAQTVGVTSTTTKKMTPATPEQELAKVCARLRCIATVPASIPFIKCFNVTKSKISLGRSIDTCDIILDSTRVAKMISRVHAVIERVEMEQQPTSMLGRIWKGKRKRYRWTIKDQSVNGLFVNDIRVSSCDLSDGDTITLGGGMSTKMGQKLAQPMSEFIFKWEQVEDEEDEEIQEENKEGEPAAKRQRHDVDSTSETQDYSAVSDGGATQLTDVGTTGSDTVATLDFDACKTHNTDDIATQASDAHTGGTDDLATQAAGVAFEDAGATQMTHIGETVDEDDEPPTP